MSYRTITIPYKEPIDAAVYTCAESVGTVVYSHGLFSSKDAYKINQIAPSLNENGYTVISFSYGYTRHYTTGNPLTLALPQCAFELNAVIEFAANNYNPNLHIIGSSMGGAIALYYVATVPYIISIKSLSLIATPVHLQHIVRAIAPQGISGTYVSVGEYTIDAQSLQQMDTIELIKLIPRVDVPVCIVHGENDDVVPVSHAHDLQKHLCVPHTLHIIPNGDHTLTSQKYVDAILKHILSWLKQNP
ncbi:MAG: alpha/beta hydrolase [Spirochaetota bacterium]